MKAHLKFLAVVVLMLTANFPLHSQGYLVPNGVSYGEFIPGFGSTFRVLQNPTNGDYTGFSLPGVDANTFSFLSFADEGVRVFLVSLNDQVSLSAIQSSGYTELGYPQVDYVFSDGVPFYVGLYTGYSPQGGVYENPLFGWGQFVNNGGIIELLGGALAYQADGIYAGTQTIIQPVPEPTSLSLICLGLFGFGCCLRRRSWLRQLASQTQATQYSSEGAHEIISATND